LVVGSGWMGHQPYVYWGTSWWNASLPQQISSMGYTCIAIRHSGGFPRIQLLTKRSLVGLMTLLVMVHLVVFAILKWCWPGPGTDYDDNGRNHMILATFSTLFFYIFWYWQGQGAATLKDMLHDASTALQFVDRHIHDWTSNTGASTDTKNKQPDKIPIIFGGYSSGAHVAATVLSSESLSPLAKTKAFSNLYIQHILYVSGFLDVSPSAWVVTLLTLGVLGEWPSTVPSPLKAIQDRPQQPPSHPIHNLPPHTLLGCQNEVFGLSILDSAFCSDEYANILNQHSPGSAECKLLQEWTCNHWSVLSTMALRKALHTSLDKAFSDTTKR
jgi:hypothetical protein